MLHVTAFQIRILFITIFLLLDLCMMLLGVDPSFSRTGMCLLDTDSNSVVGVSSLSVPKVHKEGTIFQFSNSFPAAKWHATEVLKWVDEYAVSLDAVFIEYSALSSRSGGYLLPLQCMMYTEFESVLSASSYDAPEEARSVPFYLIPPTAINSIVRPKKVQKRPKKGEIPEVPPHKISKEEGKRMIVDWVDAQYGLRLNHDEASAVILAYIGYMILRGEYKNTYQLCNRWYME